MFVAPGAPQVSPTSCCRASEQVKSEIECVCVPRCPEDSVEVWLKGEDFVPPGAGWFYYEVQVGGSRGCYVLSDACTSQMLMRVHLMHCFISALNRETAGAITTTALHDPIASRCLQVMN